MSLGCFYASFVVAMVCYNLLWGMIFPRSGEHLCCLPSPLSIPQRSYLFQSKDEEFLDDVSEDTLERQPMIAAMLLLLLLAGWRSCVATAAVDQTKLVGQ